jgi:hypothetical protein
VSTNVSLVTGVPCEPEESMAAKGIDLSRVGGRTNGSHSTVDGLEKERMRKLPTTGVEDERGTMMKESTRSTITTMKMKRLETMQG